MMSIEPANRDEADEGDDGRAEHPSEGSTDTEVPAATEDGKFHELNDRRDLGRILATLVGGKRLNHVARERAQKRGGGDVLGESAFETADGSGDGGMDGVAADDRGVRAAEPTPEDIAAFLDLQERLFARLTDDLQTIARLKLEGYTNVEIAQRIGKSEALVRLKLERIKKRWRDALTDELGMP